MPSSDFERIGGVMVYDITDPAICVFANYINTRDFSADIAGDNSPEGLCFIPADKSWNGNAYLLAACEVSGTVKYTMQQQTKPMIQDPLIRMMNKNRRILRTRTAIRIRMAVRTPMVTKIRMAARIPVQAMVKNPVQVTARMYRLLL